MKYFHDGKWHERLVREIKDEAIQQISDYLDVIKKGKATLGQAGVQDRRVRCNDCEQQLVAYVVGNESARLANQS